MSKTGLNRVMKHIAPWVANYPQNGHVAGKTGTDDNEVTAGAELTAAVRFLAQCGRCRLHSA
jgi:hypothetical protein